MSNVRAFQCPNCQNYINNLMEICKFCSIPLTNDILSASINKEDFINNAYNAANNLRISAGALVLTACGMFIPFIGIMASWANLFLLVTIPLGLVYWLFKYGTTKMADDNFRQAKRNVWAAFFIWFVIFFVRVVLTVFLMAVTS